MFDTLITAFWKGLFPEVCFEGLFINDAMNSFGIANSRKYPLNESNDLDWSSSQKIVGVFST